MLYKTFKKITNTERNMKICELRYEKDLSINKLGDYFGISKQRVQAILERDLDKYIKLKKVGKVKK